MCVHPTTTHKCLFCGDTWLGFLTLTPALPVFQSIITLPDTRGTNSRPPDTHAHLLWLVGFVCLFFFGFLKYIIVVHTLSHCLFNHWQYSLTSSMVTQHSLCTQSSVNTPILFESFNWCFPKQCGSVTKISKVQPLGAESREKQFPPPPSKKPEMAAV